jgi:hypothetical protein
MPSYLLSLWLLFFSITSGDTLKLDPATADHLSVVVTLDKSAVTLLRVTIRNNSLLPVSLRADSLPWSHRGAMLLIIAEPSTQTQLEQKVVISDTFTSVITVPARGNVTGVVNLDALFPSLRDMTRRVDLVLFWAFRLEFPRLPSEVKSGSVLIERRTTSQK